MKRVEWVLFDLGGVLVDVDQSRIFAGLAAQTGMQHSEIRARVLAQFPLHDDFIVQEYLPDRLTKEINQSLGTNLTQEQVVDSVNAELGSTIETTAQLLPMLRTRIKVGCLSNTNSIHWDHMLRSYRFMSHFDRRFASQILGHAKPGSQIYSAVLKLLDVGPKQILFFDDKQENVDAALRLGWHARLYSSHDRLIAELKEFAIVDKEG
jgi:epoxide hydrolase-like predicted phosphatase